MSEKGEQFIHFHIPKTGGSSLKSVFLEYFGDERVGYMRSDGKIVKASDLSLNVEQIDRVRSIARRAGLLGVYARTVKILHKNSPSEHFDLFSMGSLGIKVAVGHFTPSHISEEVANIPRTTVVRDPLERAWSHYTHWRDSRGFHLDYPSPYSKNISFEEFVNDPSMVNYQASHIGNLDFSVIGILNNLPGFLEEIGIDPQFHIPVLNSGTHGEMPIMDPGFVRDFKAANTADYELYEMAATRS